MNASNHLKRCLLPFFLFTTTLLCTAQETKKEGYLVAVTAYKGDSILSINLPTVYIFKPLIFKNKRQQQRYNKLVRDVKKVLPISKEVNRAVIETYEYLMTLPTEKERNEHIKQVEKGLKKQYLPVMKRLTFSQGKLLIKLIDRQSNQTSYELVKAFIGPFRAGLYQAFASLFGASLKKEYDAEGEDKLTERVILLVENGQL
ncbi:MAG: DUF4294 domain-containing protein [Prevotellaceae bacterium]|jgi:hypothetical protein|nr:DUF4294 domain-containing protein [Prevotellaceae bacterium]